MVMIKNHTAIEVVKGERNYHFLCDTTSSLGEVYDVLNEMKSAIAEVIRKHEEEAKKLEPEDVNKP